VSKGKNLIPTATITVSTTERVEEYLADLVLGGFFGKNTAEAAEKVIVFGLEKLIEAKKLEPRGPVEPSGK
jgi:hypothetical protein